MLGKVVANEGKHKLADIWEETTYVVTEQHNPDIPVFTVIREDGIGRTRTLHRNVLLPIGFVRDAAPPTPKPRPVPRPRTRQQTGQRDRSTVGESTDESSDETEDESIVGYVLTTDSGAKPADEPVQPTHEDPILNGDAHFEETQAVELETETTGSVSDDDMADLQQAESPVQEQSAYVRSPVPVRRSTRERRPPTWLSSDQYDTSMSAVCKPIPPTVITPDWLQKVECISSLAQTPLFTGMEKDAARTILDIVCQK